MVDQPSTPDDTEPQRRLRVLALDDECGVRYTVQRGLAREGMEVVTANDGRQGLEILLREVFDVLLVDLRMPEMDGIAFIREAFTLWPDMPAIVMTGEVHGELAQVARELGVQKFFAKPFAIPELADTIRAEAERTSEERRAPATELTRRSFERMRILEDVTHSAIEAQTFTEALVELAEGLCKLLPNAAVAILDVEDGVGHITMSTPGLLGQEATDAIATEMTERFVSLSGKALERESITIHTAQVGTRADLTQGRLRIFLVPYLSDGNIRGILSVGTFAEEGFRQDDVAFLYQIPNHLSTVFAALRKMRQMTIRDGLTGLYNRVYIEEALEQALSTYRRYEAPMSLAIIDIDHFKQVNDNYGHPVGDQVLRDIAGVLQATARKSDVIARYGGDEFVVLLPETSQEAAKIFTDRFLHSVRETTFALNRSPLRLTCSMGVAGSPFASIEDLDPDRVMLRADQALYAAKAAGRDQAAAWSAQIDASRNGLEAAGQLLNAADATTLDQAVTTNNVLVVDDDPMVLRFFERALKREGYEVTAANSAEDGLAYLRNGNAVGCDLVVTDLRMPGVTGFEFLEHIQGIDPSIVTLVMTGEATADNAIDSLRHGAYDFIKKPPTLGLLYAVLKRAADYRRIVLENRRYQNRLEDMVQQKSAHLMKTLAEVEESYAFTMEALIGLLDAREEDTGRHSARVRELSLVLGREMGLPSGELKILAQGALLHDIGKIGVPDAVLCKPGPLDDDEWELMRQHSAIGYRILNACPRLEQVANIVRSHHERFDGTGYPQKLAKDDICIGARVFAVVDSYDAMRADRAYRAALPEEEAVRRLKQASGSQFGPEIVTAFMRCREAMARCFIEYSGPASSAVPDKTHGGHPPVAI